MKSVSLDFGRVVLSLVVGLFYFVVGWVRCWGWDVVSGFLNECEVKVVN